MVMMTTVRAATVGEILTIPFTRPRHRFDILADPEYGRVRNHLITFLEERATPRQISLTEKRKEEAQTSITAEELLVIERYTGFNRFRSRYRQQQPMVEPVEIRTQGGTSSCEATGVSRVTLR